MMRMPMNKTAMKNYGLYVLIAIFAILLITLVYLYYPGMRSQSCGSVNHAAPKPQAASSVYRCRYVTAEPMAWIAFFPPDWSAALSSVVDSECPARCVRMQVTTILPSRCSVAQRCEMPWRERPSVTGPTNAAR
jgi:hypothetical protein